MNVNAVYPGTFDPITNGHLDLIKRAAVKFSPLVVAVAANPLKSPLFSLETRIACVRDALAHESNIQVIGFNGLLVDFVLENGANCIVRGLRNESDFEHEFQLAMINRQLSHQVETFFLMSSLQCLCISSSAVRELVRIGADISPFVPRSVIAAFAALSSG